MPLHAKFAHVAERHRRAVPGPFSYRVAVVVLIKSL
jgi:hypothetical protein